MFKRYLSSSLLSLVPLLAFGCGSGTTVGGAGGSTLATTSSGGSSTGGSGSTVAIGTGGAGGALPTAGASGQGGSGGTSSARGTGGASGTGGGGGATIGSGGSLGTGGVSRATGGSGGSQRTGGVVSGSGGVTGGTRGGGGTLGTGGSSAIGGATAGAGGTVKATGGTGGNAGSGGGSGAGGAACTAGTSKTGGATGSFGPLTLYTPASGDPSPGCLYARALQLHHGGACNDRMYATFERYVPGTPAFPIYESTDSGRTWTKVSDVADQVNGWGNRYQPFLYELPEAIGELAAGTVLLAGNSIPSDLSKTKLDIYKSTDALRTWTFVSSVASGGKADPSGSYDPVWEPFLLAVGGKLICYYSDETDPAHSQKLVHKTSTDGISWGAAVEDVALATQNLRPGMSTVAKMANGSYIMTFEIVGNGNTSYFKTSADPESWNPSSQGTSFGSSGSPYVVVMSDGKIVATSNGNDKLYENTGNGTGTWSQVTAPTGRGYTRALVPLSDGNLFVIVGGAIGASKNTVTYGAFVP